MIGMRGDHHGVRSPGAGPVTVALATALGCVLAGCAAPAPVPAESQRRPVPATSQPPTPRPQSPAPTTPRSRTAPERALLRGVTAVDGDTVARGALQVRVLGIDTPEIGECGYTAAANATQRFVRRGIVLRHRSGRDRYGRLLAYVRDGRGRDLGTHLLRRGLANARYDATDGYQWHPLQDRYRALDGRVRHRCGRTADGLGGPEPYRRPAGEPFPNCDAAGAAGAAPLRRGDPGWNPNLDGDGDGVACE